MLFKQPDIKYSKIIKNDRKWVVFTFLLKLLFQRMLSEQPKIKTALFIIATFFILQWQKTFLLFFFLLPKSICIVNCSLPDTLTSFYFTSEFMYHHGNEMKMLSRYGTVKATQTLSHPYNSLESRQKLFSYYQ